MKKNLLFPGIFGGIGLILLIAAYFVWAHENKFMAYAQTVTGKVLSLEYLWDTDANNGSYFPVIEYTYNGRVTTFRSVLGSNPASYSVGDNVEVYFNPAQWQDAQIKSFTSQWLAVILLSGIGFLFTAIGVGIGVFVIQKNNRRY
ncbi:MAG: DUF3592 domain-containing protein [Cytophagaceae bacterium]